MKNKLKTNLGELQEILNKQIIRKHKKREEWDKTIELNLIPTKEGWEIEK